jgi:hypothetical protein
LLYNLRGLTLSDSEFLRPEMWAQIIFFLVKERVKYRLLLSSLMGLELKNYA